MTVVYAGLSPWGKLLQSELVVTRDTLVPFTPYSLVMQGPGGNIIIAGDHGKIMFFSEVYEQGQDIQRSMPTVNVYAGELVVSMSHHQGGNRWPLPRLEPALRYRLVLVDSEATRFGRVPMYVCIPTTQLRRVLGLAQYEELPLAA
jgi:hypothetical protein